VSISNTNKAVEYNKPIPRLLKRSERSYSSEEDVDALKREILTISKKKDDKKAVAAQRKSETKNLQETSEREEVIGRHKNDGQKHFKGAR